MTTTSQPNEILNNSKNQPTKDISTSNPSSSKNVSTNSRIINSDFNKNSEQIANDQGQDKSTPTELKHKHDQTILNTSKSPNHSSSSLNNSNIEPNQNSNNTIKNTIVRNSSNPFKRNLTTQKEQQVSKSKKCDQNNLNVSSKKKIDIPLWDMRDPKDVQNQIEEQSSVTEPIQFALKKLFAKPSPDYPSGKDFSVERIIALKNLKDEESYLIKWKDMHEDESFWVSKSELEKFNDILDCFLLSITCGNRMNASFEIEGYKGLIATLEPNISIFMNLVNQDTGAPISIINTVDNSEPPKFFYTNNYLLNDDIRENVLIDQSRLIGGCYCPLCLPSSERNKCSCVDNTDMVAYNSRGILLIDSNNSIYECNSKCLCARIKPCICFNRTTQRERKIKLQIFKTHHKGWGVRTLEDIPKGTFISIYTGLVMLTKNANELGKTYETQGFSYLFDLDGNTSQDSDPIYTVDATDFGNFSRFLNHSCEPNMFITSVFTDHQDIHNIALFTKCDIKAFEELCYDYTGGSHDDTNFNTGIPCHCGAPTCRKILMM